MLGMKCSLWRKKWYRPETDFLHEHHKIAYVISLAHHFWVIDPPQLVLSFQFQPPIYLPSVTGEINFSKMQIWSQSPFLKSFLLSEWLKAKLLRGGRQSLPVCLQWNKSVANQGALCSTENFEHFSYSCDIQVSIRCHLLRESFLTAILDYVCLYYYCIIPDDFPISLIKLWILRARFCSFSRIKKMESSQSACQSTTKLPLKKHNKNMTSDLDNLFPEN